MTGRPTAVTLLCGYLLLVALTAATVAHGADEPAVVTAIRHEFGNGPLGGCFTRIAWRESRYRADAANWHDRHADGSRGSFGALQIGALWRRAGETVAAFARRMFVPRENARVAHALYRRFGLNPWGGRCG